MHVVYRGIFKLLALATIVAVTTSVAFYLAVSTDNATLTWIVAVGFAVIVAAKTAHLIRLIGISTKRSEDNYRGQ
jgi:hypothetical protein